MLFYLSLLSAFLSIIFLIFNAKKYRSSIYIGGFFLLLSLYGLIHHSLLYTGSVYWVSAGFLNLSFLAYLIGPMFYWYVRSVLTDKAELRRWDFIHILPSVIFLLITLPYILTSWTHKTEIAEMLVHDIGYLREVHVSLLYNALPASVHYFSRPTLILLYAIGSAVMLIQWILKKNANYVLSRQRYIIGWLSVLIIFLFIMMLGNLLILVDSFVHEMTTDFYKLNSLLVFSALGFIGMLISPFFFPFILYGLPRVPISVTKSQNSRSRNHVPDIMEPRHHLNLESNYIRSIGEKADSYMKEIKPYLQKDFNMVQLSSLIQVPLHHLAYYFRESRKQSFNDYKNHWRIKHAKELILDGRASKLTLETIGSLSGFASRNTFFTAFKKVEGISPSTFLTTPPSARSK